LSPVDAVRAPNLASYAKAVILAGILAGAVSYLLNRLGF
jgi:hypothetical protein